MARGRFAGGEGEKSQIIISTLFQNEKDHDDHDDHDQVGGLIWEGSVWKGVLAAHANWAFKLTPVLV